jgi:hypothetical protein
MDCDVNSIVRTRERKPCPGDRASAAVRHQGDGIATGRNSSLLWLRAYSLGGFLGGRLRQEHGFRGDACSSLLIIAWAFERSPRMTRPPGSNQVPAQAYERADRSVPSARFLRLK